ncbi:hypothetical protein VZT92_010933 [Zoarces viviparus]|uniref:Uncharacterized protein n=1 Tax=Zoarces viviparus TaxID=48416 RepID=A0AAW1F9S2_ZOAVI
MIPPGFGRMASASTDRPSNLFFLDGTVLDGYFLPPSSAPFSSFMHQRWLACRSARQLSALIRCLAGSDRTSGMVGVLAGSCPWHKARGTDVEDGEARPVRDTG